MPEWTFLTNHALVLITLSGDPTMRLRDVASHIDITERAVQRIVAELEEAGYLVRAREGRRNRYLIREGRPRHDLDAALPLRELLGLDEEHGRVAPVARGHSFID